MEYVNYRIVRLETKEALKYANDLDEIIMEESFTFNLDLKWVRPFGMLLTACCIKQFRNKFPEIPFNFTFNETSSGISYASHMGFFKSVSSDINFGNNPGQALGNDNYIPITKLNFNQILKNNSLNKNGIEMGNAIESKASEMAKILCRDNEELNILFTYLIREILRNIPEHANCNEAWICGQYWNDGKAEIAIIDEGIGV